MKREKKNKGGRPSKLNTISLKDVEVLAGYGLTDKQIADVLNICKATLNNYKQNPKFLDSLKRGKAKADNYVIGSLFHRAIGYSHPEVQLFCYRGKVIQTKIMKHYPPDTIAAIFWLKNRKPDQWRDKQEVEHDFKAGLLDKFKEINNDDLRKRARELALRITGDRSGVRVSETN